MRQPEAPRHKSEKKIPFYGTLGFLTCSKNRAQKYQNSPPYSILKLTFLEIFKIESFLLSQFSPNFDFKKFLFYRTVGFLTCFSIDPQKPLSKVPKTHLYSILKLTFLEIFKNKSFRLSQFS